MFRLLLGVIVALLACPAAAQTDGNASVVEGMSWLHSFEYERALAAFERAEKVDSRTPLAYWGQAMCYQQLLWGNENVEEARRILARAKTSGALQRATEWERAWLASLAPLFGDGDRATRVANYARAMDKLAAEYPDDPDVASFHGLALLATRVRGLAGAHASAAHDDQSSPQLAGSAEQQQAAQIFARVLQKHPTHPGALHYLIHTWDDPVNARKALDAARVYPLVAPESSHARHMPAHVFMQLGMWREAIESDEAAAAAADAKVKRDGLPVTAQDFHPLSWLVYEYTQAGRFDDARRALERIRVPAEETKDPRLLSMEATLRGRIAIEEQNWDAVRGPNFVNYEELFAIGFSAAHRGDTSLAERARVRLGEMAKLPRYADRRPLLEIMALQIGALLRVRSGDTDGGLALLADATRTERNLPAPIGPPPLIKPAQEQYAETLLTAGRFEEALAQFEGVLERTAGRRLALQGRQRAVAASSPTTRRAWPVTRAWPVGGGLITVILILLAVRRRQFARDRSSDLPGQSKGVGVPRTKSRGKKSA
jgi:tetratricopeptide (TPR) repeat protein